MEFVKKHLFWIFLILILAAAVGLYQFGVAPLWSANSEEQAKLEENERKLQEIEARAAKLPSDEIIAEHTRHKQWLTDEYAKSLEILREKDKPLESKPISASNPTPDKFKAVYKEEADSLRKRLSRIAVGDVLPIYRWETGPDFPATGEYDLVEKRLIIIKSLFFEMQAANVQKLEKIGCEERPARRGARDPLAYDVFGVTLRLRIPENQVIPFVERILKPKSGIPVLMKGVSIQRLPKEELVGSPRGQAQPVRLSLTIDILDFAFADKPPA
ncbi:MAG: hypothetical protein FJ279_05775 [Planctomycetes bacterium]|nr:hypothetical protein [Planctomycetota bacterium]MBM4081314.1 hypothetical protein [Planctomycetota bacterium]MBM4083234.1 hypothetical protein [Planctomycetota bacterium]